MASKIEELVEEENLRMGFNEVADYRKSARLCFNEEPGRQQFVNDRSRWINFELEAREYTQCVVGQRVQINDAEDGRVGEMEDQINTERARNEELSERVTQFEREMEERNMEVEELRARLLRIREMTN